MSENTQSNQTVVIALVVIAVLLAAAVGVIVYKQSTGVPPVTQSPASSTGNTANTGTTGTDGGTTGGTTGGSTGAAAPSASGEFDAKTATKVPKGMTPEQMLKAYNEDVIGGKYDDAYKLLPLSKQQSYGTAQAYADQVKAYGITSYEIGKPSGTGDTVAIAATQVTPQMPITYTWTFKKVGGQWYVVSREMGGSTN